MRRDINSGLMSSLHVLLPQYQFPPVNGAKISPASCFSSTFSCRHPWDRTLITHLLTKRCRGDQRRCSHRQSIRERRLLSDKSSKDEKERIGWWKRSRLPRSSKPKFYQFHLPKQACIAQCMCLDDVFTHLYLESW